MRIIKLSPQDEAMKTPESTKAFFLTCLAKREPQGKFLLTQRFDIRPGERLVFSYLGEVAYFARAKSGRGINSGTGKSKYPFYFCVDVATIRPAGKTKLRLRDFEDELREAGVLSDEEKEKSLARGRGWAIVEETRDNEKIIDRIIENWVV